MRFLGEDHCEINRLVFQNFTNFIKVNRPVSQNVSWFVKQAN